MQKQAAFSQLLLVAGIGVLFLPHRLMCLFVIFLVSVFLSL